MCSAHTTLLHVSAAACNLISLPCADHADNVPNCRLNQLATTSEQLTGVDSTLSLL